MSSQTEQAAAAAFWKSVGAWKGEGSEVSALSPWEEPLEKCPLPSSVA